MAFKNKWKYQKEFKKSGYDEYLILPKNKKTKIKIKNWDFTIRIVEGEGKNVFITDVIEVDGKKVNKTLLISNYDNLQFLKKKLKKKKEYELELTRKYNKDDMENYFEIEVR